MLYDGVEVVEVTQHADACGNLRLLLLELGLLPLSMPNGMPLMQEQRTKSSIPASPQRSSRQSGVITRR